MKERQEERVRKGALVISLYVDAFTHIHMHTVHTYLISEHNFDLEKWVRCGLSISIDGPRDLQQRPLDI